MSHSPGRILIVDDDPELLQLLKEYFSGGQFKVMTAQQGADALMIANFYRPDAVVLDIMLTGMDGLKVLRALRAMDSTVPVVMLTGSCDEHIARDTLTMGAFDFVPKPFDFAALGRVVAAAVAAGAGRMWSSPFGVARAASPSQALTTEQVAALGRQALRSRAVAEPLAVGS